MFSMRQDLMENEDSAVLGMLMSYKEPEDVLVIIEQAQKVRDSLINGVPWQIEEVKDETYLVSNALNNPIETYINDF
jgi:hypothetical protein